MKKENTMRTMKCSKCNELVENVGETAKSVVCWKCTNKNLEDAIEEQVGELIIEKKKGGKMVEEKKVSKIGMMKQMIKEGKTDAEIVEATGAKLSYAKTLRYKLSKLN